MKVLHLPSSVGGQSWGLAQGERRLGLDSRVLATLNNYLNYPCDFPLHWEKKGPIGIVLDSIRTFLKYRNKFDVFHFNYGSSLVDFHKYGVYHWDLPFYPKGKKMIFTYNGCDARQKYKTMAKNRIAACHEKNCNKGICDSGRMEKRRVKSIRIVSQYVHHIFALNPDLLYFLPQGLSSFLPYAVASWYEIQAVPYKIGRNFKIAHSPTDRAVKGSRYIIAALENLKKKYPIEIILIEGMSNKEALEICKQADLVIDQVLVGWYGGFAVEAMRMGKPVGVFIREEDLRFIPERMAKDLKNAVINLNPFDIEKVLEVFLENPQMLHTKSEAALEYVHRWHDPTYVAGMTKAVYES